MTLAERELSVDTSRRQIVDLTAEVVSWVRGVGGDGLLCVLVPHATAGVALIETGAGSEPDLVAALERLLPQDDRYTHAHGSRGHGAHHLLPAIVGSSLTIPVSGGRLRLGTWQRVCLVDLNADNPHRAVRLALLSG